MKDTVVSKISNQPFNRTEMVFGRNIHKRLLEFIREIHPDFNTKDAMNIQELNNFREQYIAQMMKKEIGQITALEDKVLSSIHEHTMLTEKLDQEESETLTFGQRVSDKVASFGGSWTFIISFMTFLILWILLNAIALGNKGYDPYPFILLNLILSCIAALQAPIIMMSQNRQEEKDRIRAKKDYMINLKSELEIRILHEKIDHIIRDQQDELLEIQRIQIEMMNDILAQMNKEK